MKLTCCRAVGLLLIGFFAGCARQAPPPPPSVVLVPAADQSARFDSVNRHLELGGLLYGYIDVDGDADRVADLTQTALQQMLKTVPGMESVSKVKLRPIFHALGLEDLKALGFSSVREANGEFRDRAFLATPSGRHGLLAVLGGPAAPLQHVGLAPTDTDLYEELTFDVPALTAAVKRVMIEVQGKAKTDQVQRQMEASGAMAGVSPLGLVHSLKGRMTVVVRMDPDKTMRIPGPKPVTLPRFELLLGIDGLGSALKPLLDKSPLLRMKEDNGRQYYTPQIPMMIEGLRPVLVVSGGDLYFGSDEFFTHECLNRAAGAGLAQNADYARLTAELGAKANDLVYATPRFYIEMKRMLELNPELEPANRAVLEAALGVMTVPDRPTLYVVQNLPDGVMINGRLNRSFKLNLAAALLYNPVTLALLINQQQQRVKAAMSAGAVPPAVPAPRPAVKLTPDERVERNLRLLSALANAYYRRMNTDHADYSDLVGPGKLIPRLVPAEGEDYSTVKLQQGEPIEVKVGDGRTLRYPPGPR